MNRILFGAIGRIALAMLVLIPVRAHSESSTTATGTSRDLNPAISVNMLLLYRSGLTGGDHHEPEGESHSHGIAGDGFSIQETEVQFSASVDPYSRADLVFAMHGTGEVELEEGFVEATGLPRGFGFRAGKFYIDFGRHNTLHTHEFPFVDRPVAWEELLGEHGLNGVAAEFAWLTPLPWFAEIGATAFPLTETIYGDHEVPENKWGGAGKLRQLWDSSDQSTVELGLSYAGGELYVDDGHRHLIGADAGWKWSGRGAQPRKAELMAEWIRRIDDTGTENHEQDGISIHAMGRISRRVSFGARFDLFKPEGSGSVEDQHHDTAKWTDDDEDEHDRDDVATTTLSLAFVPSEFQSLRFDYLHRSEGDESDHGIRTQLNFTIGSHPAHRY